MFTGNVHVRAETQGDLRADRATVEITNGALASADVSGSPAQFEQTRVTAGRLVKGHAASIHYDVAAATIKLAGDACADRRTQRQRHAQPVHHLQPARPAHRATTVPGPGTQVHMTIVPKSAAGKAPTSAVRRREKP